MFCKWKRYLVGKAMLYCLLLINYSERPTTLKNKKNKTESTQDAICYSKATHLKHIYIVAMNVV